MTDPQVALPPFLARVADAAGMEAAQLIADRHGGVRVTISARANGRNWLARLVGPMRAAAIIDALGAGVRYDVPLGRTERRPSGETLNGLSAPAAARRLGVTERTIRKRRAGQRGAA